MSKILDKTKFILSEEGLIIFIQRLFRYFFYRLKRYLKPSDKKNKQKWDELKNKYSGQRVFLIGNGPSLNKTSLHLLKDEFTICFNRFDLFIERLGWTPTAYAVSDDLVFSQNIETINKMIENCQYTFLPDIHPSAPLFHNFKKQIKNKDDVHWFYLDKLGFSQNLPQCGLNKTVANVAFQILTYMGFKEIYLIGVDLDYSNPIKSKKISKRIQVGLENEDMNHFDTRYFGKGMKFNKPRVNETYKKFEEANIFLKNNGVKVFNAGIGGKLEVFERVEFRSLFSFSDHEEMTLLLNNLDISKNDIKDSLINTFPQATEIDDLEHWSDSIDIYIVKTEIAIKSITAKIQKYQVFGPFKNEYLFVKRKK